jgi:hypothetical protein
MTTKISTQHFRDNFHNTEIVNLLKFFKEEFDTGRGAQAKNSKYLAEHLNKIKYKGELTIEAIKQSLLLKPSEVKSILKSIEETPYENESKMN